MSEVIRVRLLLAKFPDDTEPVVIGCVDETIWDFWEEEDERVWRDAARTSWGADPTDYEWREVWAEFAPADLVEAFRTPVVAATVSNTDSEPK